MDLNTFLAVLIAVAPFLSSFFFVRYFKKIDKQKEENQRLKDEKTESLFESMNNNLSEAVEQLKDLNKTMNMHDKDIAVLSTKVIAIEKDIHDIKVKLN